MNGVAQSISADPVLARFRDAAVAFYGPRLERVVLFGSRARGEPHRGSDYDIAVFLHDLGGLWDELGPLAEISAEILLETGALVSAKPFRAGSYDDARPLMSEILRDGIPL